jgi:hypothetical protein
VLRRPFGALLQVPARVVAADEYERLLDQRYIFRAKLRVFVGGLTIGFHVCNYTFACNSTCNRKGLIIMNTDDTSPRPPGYWFGAIDRGLREKMRETFTDLGLSRGEWRILHTLADGPKPVDEIEDALPPGERHRRMGARMFGGPGRGFGPGFWAGRGPGFGDGNGRWFGRGFAPGHAEPHSEPHDGDQTTEHAGGNDPHDAAEHAHGHAHHGHDAYHGGRSEHGDRRERRRPRSVAEVLVDFAERGWVVLDDTGATLTDTGRAIHDEARSRVTELRASITEGVSDADYQTTIATLEKMARNVGWGEAEAGGSDADGDDGETSAGGTEPEPGA